MFVKIVFLEHIFKDPIEQIHIDFIFKPAFEVNNKINLIEIDDIAKVLKKCEINFSKSARLFKTYFTQTDNHSYTPWEVKFTYYFFCLTDFKFVKN